MLRSAALSRWERRTRSGSEGNFKLGQYPTSYWLKTVRNATSIASASWMLRPR